MQKNLSHIISFKVASYSACYLTNGDCVSYLVEKFTRESSEEVEMFSISIEIVKAALLSYKMFSCLLSKFSMLWKKIRLHVSMQHVKSSSNLDCSTH